jgi:hypothetical protein
MKIFTTIVPPTGRGSLVENERREQSAREVIDRAHANGAQLVLFPSGLLRARREDEIEAQARDLLAHASMRGVAIVFGIDTESLAAKHAAKRVEHERLPFFLVAQSRDDGPYYWRQRSTTSSNGGDAPVSTLVRRSLLVQRTRVDVLACGEVFNHVLRADAGPWADRIIVNPTHTAHGARFFHARTWARQCGSSALLRATHAWSAATAVGSRTSNVGVVGGTYVRSWQR